MELTEREKNEELLDSGLFYCHIVPVADGKPKRKIVLTVDFIVGLAVRTDARGTEVMMAKDAGYEEDRFYATETPGVLARRLARARRGMFPKMDAEVEVEDEAD